MLRALTVPVFAVLLALAPISRAQPRADWSEIGAFRVENFGPRDYGADPQNWALALDGRGILYAANDGLVLEYDGVSWRQIPLPDGPTVRTLAVDAQGRVFVGAHDELGVIEPDSVGRPRFRSLRPLLPADLQRFGEIRSTIATPEGVFFSSPAALFRWSGDPEEMRVWRIPGLSRRMGYVGGRLFVHERGRGLLVLDGDSLRSVPGGAALAVQGAGILPRAAGDALILTRTDGLFRFDGTRVAPFPTDADAFLKEAQVYSGVELPDGIFALPTLRSGLVLLDDAGRLLRVIDRDDGLRDADVKAVVRDRTGHLWLGLNNGIARVDVATPLTFFGETTGLNGFVLDVARYGGQLFVATSRGVRVLVPASSGGAPAFRAVPNLEEFCHMLQPTPRGLLAACDHGVFEVSASASKRVAEAESAFSIHLPPQQPDRLYVGRNDGVSVLEHRNGRWSEVDRIAELRAEVRHLVEHDGVLWIGTVLAGLHRADVQTDAAAMHAERVAAWTDANASVFALHGNVVFGSSEGLMRAERIEDSTHFTPDPDLGSAIPPGTGTVTHLATAPNGDVWFRAGGINYVARSTEPGGYSVDVAPLGGLTQADTYDLFPEPDGVLWIGTAEGLVRYDGRAAPPSPPIPVTLLRGVTQPGTDHVRYGGTGMAALLTLDHAQNGLRFSYSAPGVEAAEYQTWLDGESEGWSKWTTDTRQDFTNLSEGRYVFRVRGRNRAGEIGPEATYAFVIQPPWHRTFWAYGLYLLVGIGVGYVLLRVYHARLRARNVQLEHLVQTRTAEVEAQKRRLEDQNARIEEQAARLRVLDEAKNRFFANVSHEFRTPLTLILGPVEDLLTGMHGALPDAARASLDVSRRSAYRLLRLVNRLLDLAKLESGHMTLAPRRDDLVAFVRGTVAAFHPLAERRGIALGFASERASLVASFDPEKLEEVFVNLLSNAVKATPDGGRIDVSLGADERWAEIRVADTGSGIEPESLSVIFDRFRQGRNALPGTVGTGIGLNLVQELVHLHGGVVSVESEVGAGSTFTVRLPISEVESRKPEVGGGISASGGEIVQIEATDAVFSGKQDHSPGDGLRAARPDPASPDDFHLPPLASHFDHTTVLVVDDNPDIRAYVRQHLESVYRIEEAGDGDEGYEKARLLLPDLIISDVMMPRRDGYSLCRALKSDRDLDHVPVILLTAKASSASRIEGLDAEADDYLTKPFNARELLARVRNLIASRQRLRDRFRQEVVVRPSDVTVTSADAAFLEQVRAAIESHLADADFSVEALAEAVSLSPSQLQRRVKAFTELTPVQLVKRMRLERAADLLAQRAGSVSEVAYAVGFNSHAYFAQSFREHFGVTPSAYGKEATT